MLNKLNYNVKFVNNKINKKFFKLMSVIINIICNV